MLEPVGETAEILPDEGLLSDHRRSRAFPYPRVEIGDIGAGADRHVAKRAGDHLGVASTGCQHKDTVVEILGQSGWGPSWASRGNMANSPR